MVILYGQSIFKENMFLLLNKSISINESLQINHQDIWQLFKKMSLVGLDLPAILLVAFHWLFLKIVVQAIFDGAFVPWDVQGQNKTGVKSDGAVTRILDVELVTDDATENVTDYTVFDV